MNSLPVLTIISQAVTPYNVLTKILLTFKNSPKKVAGKCERAPEKLKADTSVALQY